MFFTKLIQFLRGYLTICVTGSYPERFLNVCANRGILIWNVFPRSASAITCSISIRGFRILPPIARKTNVRIKILQKRGFPIWLAKHKKRKWFLFGIIFFLFLFVFLNQFIWDIEIVGCKTISPRVVTEKLAECGLKVGAFRPFINERKLKNEMLLSMPELAWIWPDKNGSKVTVEIRERVPVPEIYDPDAYGNLIASKDGIIDSMTIKHGTPMVSLGDTVKSGDILVAGLLVSDKGVPPRTVQAEGQVCARVWYEKTQAFSLWHPNRQETGKKESKYILHLFGLKLNLFASERSAFTEYSETTERRDLSLFGNYLGIAYTRILRSEETISYEKIQPESVAQSGALVLSAEIDEQAGHYAERKDLHSSHAQIDEDTIEVTVVAEYIEDIAQPMSCEKPKIEDPAEDMTQN